MMIRFRYIFFTFAQHLHYEYTHGHTLDPHYPIPSAGIHFTLHFNPQEYSLSFVLRDFTSHCYGNFRWYIMLG
jgi:hypothetical protein